MLYQWEIAGAQGARFSLAAMSAAGLFGVPVNIPRCGAWAIVFFSIPRYEKRNSR